MRRILLTTTLLVAPMMATAQTCNLDDLVALAPEVPTVAPSAPTPPISDVEIRSHQVLRRLASRGAALRI